MKLIRLTAILVLPLILTVYISSCAKFGPDCPKAFRHFDIYGIKAYNHGVDNSTSGVKSFVENDTVEFESYYISVPYSVNFYSFSGPKNNNFFITSAYALDCVENGYGGSTEGIDSIVVIAKSDFNSNYRTGDTVSAIFDAAENFYGSSAPLSHWKSLDDYALAYREIIYNNSMILKPHTGRPLGQGPHSFRIILSLRNGEKYITETPAIFFR